MSTQNVIVVPVAGEGARQPGQGTTKIASTIQSALEENAHPTQPQPGPLKQIIAHQESLYQYINWNDPIRTLGSYIGVLSLLFGAHYLPLTQMALKGGVTALGLVSVTESASRMLGNRSLSAQLRPKEYKTFPEPTLNATLKDIHDFVQYAAVQAQRIIFGQDLQKTYASFLALTALYWLTKALSPFWLAILAITTLYTAPLLFSPRGRQITREASTNAQELAAAASHNSRMLAHDATTSAQNLATTVTDTSRAAAHNASTRIASLANTTKETGTAALGVSDKAHGSASRSSSSAAGSLKQDQQAASHTKEHAYTNAHGPTVYASGIDGAPGVRGLEGDKATPRGSAAAVETKQTGFTGAKVTEGQEPAVMYTTARDEGVERGVLGR